MSRGPPCELCSREPGHWGEVVRACLKQYTQGFSQSSHTQSARSMSFSRRLPAVLQRSHTENNSTFISPLMLDRDYMKEQQSHTHTCIPNTCLLLFFFTFLLGVEQLISREKNGESANLHHETKHIW